MGENRYQQFKHKKNGSTVKLDFKELLNKEQIDFQELFTVPTLLYYKSTVK